MDLRQSNENAGSRWSIILVLAIVGVCLIAIQVSNVSVGQHGPVELALKANMRSIIFLIAYVFAVGSVAGLVLTVFFFINYSDFLRNAPPHDVSSQVLIRTFLVYLIGSFVMEAIAVSSVTLSGLDITSRAGNLVYLTLQTLAILTAFVLGLGALAVMTGFDEGFFQKIGLKPIPIWSALKWGFGTYIAALPFFCAAVLITQKLDQTIFRSIKTPEHPLIPYFTGGEDVSFMVVLVLGAAIAPLVEETFFRGVLYGTLRGWMRVWGAAVLSAIVFALGHPLPSYFLPIFVLGVVFAIAREKTGSLLPSMIAHCFHNGVAIILIRLLY